MILVWGAVLGVLVGWLLGGRLRHLEQLNLRGGWLVVLALVIQLLIFPLGSGKPLISWGTAPLHFLSYACLAGFLILNLRHWPLALLAAGLIANLLVISLNSGYMPANADALRRAGKPRIATQLQQEKRVGNVVLMGEDTHLNWLGDWLYLPGWVPLATAFSPGDVAIALGLATFFPYAMRRRW